MIVLSGVKPLVAGGKSDVYTHPTDKSLLIKVMRPKTVERAIERASFLRGRRKRYYHLLNYWRCLEEQTAVLATEGHIPPHLEEVVGFVETDLGIGLVVRGETYRGQLAPTLRSIMKAGQFTEDMLRKADEFFDWLLSSPIIINDMKPVNLVFSEGRDGLERFVLIDGYGETAAIPVKSWFPWLNRAAKRKKIRKIRSLLTEAVAANVTVRPNRQPPVQSEYRKSHA